MDAGKAQATIPGRETTTPYVDAGNMRDQEGAINEQTFSRLATEYDDVNRTCEFLEQALHCARTRQQVLSAAMEVLNAPAKTVAPSVR